MSIYDILPQIAASVAVSGTLTTVLNHYFNKRNIHHSVIKSFEFQIKNRIYNELGAASFRFVELSSIAYRRIHLLRKRIEHKEEEWIERYSEIKRTV
jgi:hypothetical protein